LAIPLSSVIQDGLAKIVFRRDPKNPDKAIRMEADLGVNDGRWVVIKSGMRDGDEVVLDGVYQLMIATSGTVEKGGHFHSDGTFHAGEDEKK
jgi:multidrug efflux pump subunit AcrA (membrane-fusion protein)